MVGLFFGRTITLQKIGNENKKSKNQKQAVMQRIQRGFMNIENRDRNNWD